MRAGIITFHCSYNYGSMLQAYAMSKTLENLGCDTKIINYVSGDFEQYKVFRIRYYKHPRYFLEDLRYFRKNMKRRRSFEAFKKKYFKMTPSKYTRIKQMRRLNDQFDVFVCGSDQIWNAACTGGLDPVFFLQFADSNKRRIAYAPSLAQRTIDVDTQLKMKQYLQGMYAVSVREESTLELVRSLTDLQVETVLDPTLLLKASDYEGMISKKTNDAYIFLYMLESYDAEMVNYANKLAEEHSLNVVYVSRDTIELFGNKGNVYGASPEDFLGFIRDARYIVTNSFHATVFSVLFRKQFMTFKTQHSYARMVDFLNSLGLEDRIYADGNDINKQIAFEPAEKKLDQMRVRCMEYLERALWGNE